MQFYVHTNTVPTLLNGHNPHPSSNHTMALPAPTNQKQSQQMQVPSLATLLAQPTSKDFTRTISKENYLCEAGVGRLQQHRNVCTRQPITDNVRFQLSHLAIQSIFDTCLYEYHARDFFPRRMQNIVIFCTALTCCVVTPRVALGEMHIM
jgi:hypothetical protein